MFQRLQPAIERIAFQGNSALAKALVALCEETVHKVTAKGADGSFLWASEVTGVGGGSTYGKRFAKQCTELLTAGTGFKINVEVAHMGECNAFMYPVFGKELNTSTTIAEILRQLDRLAGQQKRPAAPDMQAIYDRLAGSLNLGTGKIDKDISDLIHIEIVLAAELFVQAHNRGPDSGFTGEEIAAITLHEVGHGITFVENFQNGFYRSLEARDSFQLLIAQGTPETLVNLVADVSDTVAKLGDPARKKGYQTLLDNAKSSGDTNKQVEVASYVALDYLIGQTLGVVLGVCLLPLRLGVFAVDVAGTRLEKEVRAASAMWHGRGGKTSDVLNTLEQTASVTERIADEYVSRHGLGRPLARALKKFGTIPTAPIRQGGIVRVLANLYLGVASVMSAAMPPPMAIPGATPYDEPLRRMALLVENNMAIFKDPTLPADIRNVWVAETEAMLREAEAAKKTAWPESTRTFIWVTLLRLSSAGSITGMLVNANLQKDYSKLQDLTRRLIRNPLYFRAAQIQQQIDKTST